MSSDSVRYITEVYREAALFQFAKEHMTARQWHGFGEIDKRHKQAQRDEERRFGDERDARVLQEKERLIDKAGGVPRKLTYTGNDLFSHNAISYQAAKNVELAHKRRMLGMKQAENDEKMEFVVQAGLANDFKDRGREAFNRSAERGQLRGQFQSQSRSQ